MIRGRETPFTGPVARIREFTLSVRKEARENTVCLPREEQESMFSELMSAVYCEEDTVLP